MQNDRYDVVVIGAGLAGLSAALQLIDLRPATRIAVIEKSGHPVHPTAHKVGEALAEIGSHYFADVLGLREYLEKKHLRKMGLRFFMPAGDNADIGRRVEFGLMRYSPLPTFQIDRGELENHMAALGRERGIDFFDACEVKDVALGAESHTVTVAAAAEGRRELMTRWVVDASGRQAFLRRRLGVGIDLPVQANAAWFRTPYRITVDEWSDDPAWHAQVPTGTRWKSTCSFVGRGYWTWVINLGSGATSVGVVTDPRYVPFERIRRYDVLLDWLREVEPQLADHLPSAESGLLDFRKRKNFSHATSRAFSRQRWALAGEAAVFVDPLYSTGNDTMAIGNTLLTNMIAHELDGEAGKAFTARVRAYNRSLLGLVQIVINTFPGALEVYGDPQATSCKLLWDNVAYFAILLNMFRNGAILDTELVRSLQPVVQLQVRMNEFMQGCFREWGREHVDARSAGFPVFSDGLFEHLVTTPQRNLTRDELRDHVVLSVRRLQTICDEIVTRMSAAAGYEKPEYPYEPLEETGEELLIWSDYDNRLLPPRERRPQPAGGWVLR